jgi:5-oxoprolinase (ATP-hydrolysing)
VVLRRRLLALRLVGQESAITIEHPTGSSRDDLHAAFIQRYVQLYGHAPPARGVELESARVVASSRDEEGAPGWPAAQPRGGAPPRQARARFGGHWQEAPVHQREQLDAGEAIAGPALILEAHSTCVLEPGWSLRVHESGALVLERTPRAAQESQSRPQAVRDEVTAGRLAAIAREMGEMLQRTALSTNVKERLDYSCALLDPEGRLIVNAPHVPVHLGSLGVCVRCVRERISMQAGDVIVTNHPAWGGSHLPDVTVITPVYDGRGILLGFAANRAHHAEIGGIAPGSMPTLARTLGEEGVVIAPLHLVRGGHAQWEAVERLLSGGPHPSRAALENLADLRAQVAANQYGAQALADFAQRAGAAELQRGMDVLRSRAAAGTQRALTRLAGRGGRFEALERLDDGAPIRVRIDLDPGRAVIDFTGSAAVHPGNLNATPAIVRSAVIYVLRLLVDEPLPLNEGLVQNVEIVIPPGMLAPEFGDDPGRAPAVAGGNVETSQRLVDALLKAFEVCACSQGTMNNIVFGTAGYGYYETVCGGAGAGPGFAGASAVHTHMTNTRITDPEIMEYRYPVRLLRFAVRRGSGGRGQWRGGDGVVRQIEFLEPCELSIISQHRAEGPYGMEGGSAGAPGGQWIVRAGGAIERLAGIDSRQIRAGDRLVLETPGGGGWGAAGM